MISIIIPVYNAPEQLERCLTALGEQRRTNPCEIIIADDGSSPPLEEIAKRYHCRYGWQSKQGFRLAAARNLGARMAMGSYLWFVDQDILLNPHALENAYDVTTRFAGAFILGRYDWLPPMHISCEDVAYRWSAIVTRQLPAMSVKEVKGIVGEDPRCRQCPPYPKEEFLPEWRHWAFGGNIMVPADAFRRLGGFDEAIVGHGGEDLEFGTRAQWAGHRAVFSTGIAGYHVYHDRDQQANVQSVRRNLQYIWKKLSVEEKTGVRLTQEMLDRVGRA